MGTMLSALWAAGQTAAQLWTAAPALPVPVANNAVAAVTVDGRAVVYSFLGIDSTKRPSGVTSRSFKWSVGGTAWRPVPPPPGPGRLAATAQPVRGAIYLFGGYTVAADGSERSLPNVDILEPSSDTWRRGAPIPVPVDDAVSGVWRDSLVYLISGWHDRDNVANVQIYDPAADRFDGSARRGSYRARPRSRRIRSRRR